MAIKYDGHRIVAVVDGHSRVKLISRNGHDWTPLFRTVRRPVSCRREIVLDGEIAVPDERGVTHIGHLPDPLDGRQPDRAACFAFDLLYLDGARPVAQPDRRAQGAVAPSARSRPLPTPDLCRPRPRRGAEPFDHVRAIGAEGIVSKRAGSLFRRPRASGARPSATPPADLSLPASRNSPGRLEALHRSPPVRRRGSRACQDTRSFNKHCATTTSPRSVSLDFMFLTKLNPVYVTRMPGSEGGEAL